MRILVAGGGTGGHLYPGLAIARALVRLEPSVQPFFVGALRGIERDVLPATEFEHELLDLHPLYRTRPWRNWHTIVGAARSWRKLRGIVDRLRPRAVLGTGGYAAGLALAAGSSAGIPILLQEQNSYPGLTMRYFSRKAREIYLGFPEASRFLRVGRNTTVVDSGNPIEPPPVQRADRATLLAEWRLPLDAARVLLAVGGSQGARPINEAVAGCISELTADGTCVIWATGKAHFEHYRGLSTERAKVVAYLSPIAHAYAAADFAIGRAGAVTTAELCAWGIPSLLIPLPSAAADHQSANARALQEAGCALVMPQSELSSSALLGRVRTLFSDKIALDSMRSAALKRGRPNASDYIAQQILRICDVT